MASLQIPASMALDQMRHAASAEEAGFAQIDAIAVAAIT